MSGQEMPESAEMVVKDYMRNRQMQTLISKGMTWRVENGEVRFYPQRRSKYPLGERPQLTPQGANSDPIEVRRMQRLFRCRPLTRHDWTKRHDSLGGHM